MKEDIGYQFLDASSPKYMDEPDQLKKYPQPALQQPYVGTTISLPDPQKINLPNIDLKEAILNRESIRKYPKEAISMEELSYALYMTQGIRKIKPNVATLRTVPSAGARHAFETLILVNQVNGLKQGLYRYLAIEHQLLLIQESEDISKKVSEASLSQKMIEEASVVFIWYADSYRMTFRYGMRGYRYLFMDAGHVCQNLYLIAQQLKCGTCAIAAFDDHKLNALLGFDGKKEFVVYLGTFGKL